MYIPSSGKYSTRFHLFALVAAVVIPLVCFAGLVVYRYAKVEQTRIEGEAVRIASQTSLLVEADLKQLVSRLEGLAASSALATDDLRQFHAEAKLLTDGREETIILRDLEVGQLFNSRLPFGQLLPSSPPFSNEERASFSRGDPHVSDVYLSPRNGEPRIVVALPIMRNGAPKYVLGITIPTLRVREALLSGVPRGYIVAVGDRHGVYVARSARHEEVTGKPGLPEYVRQVVGQSGSFRSPNFEGRQLLAGYSRSDLTGWFFTANVPTEDLERPLKISLMQLAGFGAAALGVSAILALLFSRPIIAAASGLAERARQLGKGEDISPIRSHLSDFRFISDALIAAGQAISARTSERARATEREALLASIFDAAGIYVGVLDLDFEQNDMRFIAANQAAQRALSRTGPSVIGRCARDLGVGEADRAAVLGLCKACLDDGKPITGEFDLHHSDNQLYTFLGTFAPLHTGIHRVAFTAMDISDRKRSENHRQLLVNELNHRVKNSLMIAQSIASQTIRSSTSLEQARAALADRLVSLARTHDILTRENWEAAAIRDIVNHNAEPYHAVDRITVGGPFVRLLPGQALTLSLLLHELLTNSAKYGALSSEAGTIEIRWHLLDGPCDPHAVIEYKEANGPAVTPPTHKGFGSRLFAASFSSPKEGRIIVEYPSSGVVCRIEIGALALKKDTRGNGRRPDSALLA